MACELYGIFDTLSKDEYEVMQQVVFEIMQREYDIEHEKEKKRQEEIRIQKMTPLLVHGTTRTGIPVTIYGEIHKKINNKHYQDAHFDTRKDVTVWVEHGIENCSVKPHEEPMFAEAKGAEWVWFRRVKNGLPVTCIDIRSSKGLPIALLEDALRDVGGLPTLYEDPTYVALRTHFILEHDMGHPLGLFKFISTIFNSYKELKQIIQPIKELFGQYIKVIMQQMQSALKMLSQDLPNVRISLLDEYNRTFESTTFHEELKNIIRNMLVVHSLVIDAHIINLVENYTEDKPIAIFVGLNHAIRVAHLLHWKIEENKHIDMKYFQPRAMKAFTPSVLMVGTYRVLEDSKKDSGVSAEEEGRKKRRVHKHRLKKSKNHKRKRHHSKRKK
jgi:hypothetical protein